MDVESMTVSELKQELKSRGLKVSGLKAALKKRLAEAIAESETQTSSDPVTTEEVDNVDSTIADFEDYINKEHKRMTENREKEPSETQQEPKGDNDNNNEVNIDDIINKNNESIEAEEGKHQELLQTDFDLTTSTPQQPATSNTTANIIVSDFDTAPITTSTDPTALNNKDKVQERMNRFGTSSLTDSAKLESRKRRFAAMNGDESAQNGPDIKKQKVDKEAERKKIFERAQKFGTALPNNFKLSKEESEIIHKEKIERAKRFGTEHLLPKEIQKAEQDAKKAERMKRFNTDEKGKIIDNETEEEKPKDIIATKEAEGGTKLMERKLRFGTLTDTDKQKQRQERFGTGAAKNGDLSLDEMISNDKANNMKKKKFTPRQQKNNQRIQKFRQYKKNNKQFNNNNGFNNNGNNQRGRGFGNNRGRFNNKNGRGGRRGGNFGYRNNKQFNNNNNGGFNGNNNRRGGFRGNNKGRGGFNNNRRNFNNNGNNRGRQGGFNKNFNRNQNQSQANGHTAVQFSQADLQKIEARKQRFTAISDF